jgi:hypothetical protein
MQAAALVFRLPSGEMIGTQGDTASAMLAVVDEVKLSGVFNGQPVQGARYWVMRDDFAFRKGSIGPVAPSEPQDAPRKRRGSK